MYKRWTENNIREQQSAAYEAPQVIIVEVRVEKGFAVSDPTGIGEGFGRG